MALPLNKIGKLNSMLDATNAGGFLELDINLIDEDPDQPRQEFDDEVIKKMASTIQDRNVKSPISVREHPEKPGRYMLNHGAQRYRASILAKKKTIPALIDNDYTFEDQIIENIQRSNLKPLELSHAIEKMLSRGSNKTQIAAKLGVSPAYVTQYALLIHLPESLDAAFKEKRCEDVTILSELNTLRKKNPDHVGVIDKWINKQEEITRSAVKHFRLKLQEVIEPPKPSENDDSEDEGGETEGASEEKVKDKLKNPYIQIEVQGQGGRLLLKKRPSEESLGWVQFDDDGSKEEVPLSDIKIVSINED